MLRSVTSLFSLFSFSATLVRRASLFAYLMSVYMEVGYALAVGYPTNRVKNAGVTVPLGLCCGARVTLPIRCH